MPPNKRSKSQKLHDKMKSKYRSNTSGKKKLSSNASTNPNRKLKKEKQIDAKNSHFRTKQTINRLNMYRNKPDIDKMNEQPTKPQRIAPDRKWFGNVRTIDQKSLEKFRIEMAQRANKANEFLIKQKKLPTSLLVDPVQTGKVNILELEKYEDTFGPKSKRKRPKLENLTLDSMIEKVESQQEQYDHEKDLDRKKNDIIDIKDLAKDKRLEAGQSRRIWEELYKVLDSSDVICQVIDARDPMGTRSQFIEAHIKKNCPQKHLILILNKVDLVPTLITKKWLQVLSQEYPTVAYHASINSPFGKGSLINLFRQFDNFHKDKQTISVGFLGYPNVGKSSIINSLKNKKVCRAAPIPGETKIWQYVHLTKRIYLIDCPGVVYNYEAKDEVDTVLKGVVRAEKLDDPEFYIRDILKLAKKSDIQKVYKVKEWEDDEDFLSQVAKFRGRLLKGAEPDLKTVAKQILMDWQRGEIPYFTNPPNLFVKDKEEKQNEEEQKKMQNEEIDEEIVEQEDLEEKKQKLEQIVNQNEENIKKYFSSLTKQEKGKKKIINQSNDQESEQQQQQQQMLVVQQKP